ncbi:MAG TPA: ABC transporter ATP-binding protein [Gemmatimonadaceae bacterium]|nr:ABC transporter ATP-binding protein [Gemmatimonadaceae bacterium]
MTANGTKATSGTNETNWTNEAHGKRVALTESSAPVEVRHASRWYGNVVAVNDVSFVLEPGITGLLGPNGAGKSTVIHMIAGLLRPSAGEVLVEGGAAFGRPATWARMGIVPEREAVYPFLTGLEFVTLSARLHGVADARAAGRAAIEAVELEDAQHRKLETYSKGMRQRAKIAAALAHDPRILILDEPFNGMDPKQRLRMAALLRSLATGGRVILFSSHILEEVDRLASTVLVMVAGRLAASGAPREIRRLMTDRPHTFTLRTSDDRALAAALVGLPAIESVQIGPHGMVVKTTDQGAFTRALPLVARDRGVSLRELRPMDESLESVFDYLVRR